jgi:hypothetical protein
VTRTYIKQSIIIAAIAANCLQAASIYNYEKLRRVERCVDHPIDSDSLEDYVRSFSRCSQNQLFPSEEEARNELNKITSTMSDIGPDLIKCSNKHDCTAKGALMLAEYIQTLLEEDESDSYMNSEYDQSESEE